MRRLLVAGFMVLASQSAGLAADPPAVLRGAIREAPIPYRTVWQGFYVGGQGAYSWADMKFETANTSLVSSLFANSSIDELYALPPWFVMGTRSDKRFGYGAFAGYNAQWDNVIIGLDATYTRGALTGADGGSRRSEPPYSVSGYTYTVTNATSASLTLHDYGSVRIRGGYVWDNFMPYAFAGLALGRADIDRSVGIRVDVAPTSLPAPPNPPVPPAVVPGVGSGVTRKNEVLYGYSFGLGAEYMLFGGLFARAEWEHMRFNSVVNVGMHTVRGGLGYRF